MKAANAAAARRLFIVASLPYRLSWPPIVSPQGRAAKHRLGIARPRPLRGCAHAARSDRAHNGQSGDKSPLTNPAKRPQNSFRRREPKQFLPLKRHAQAIGRSNKFRSEPAVLDQQPTAIFGGAVFVNNAQKNFLRTLTRHESLA